MGLTTPKKSGRPWARSLPPEPHGPRPRPRKTPSRRRPEKRDVLQPGAGGSPGRRRPPPLPPRREADWKPGAEGLPWGWAMVGPAGVDPPSGAGRRGGEKPPGREVGIPSSSTLAAKSAAGILLHPHPPPLGGGSARCRDAPQPPGGRPTHIEGESPARGVSAGGPVRRGRGERRR